MHLPAEAGSPAGSPIRYNAAHPMPVIPAALLVVVVGGYFLFRRTDVRLVLILSAAALFFVRAINEIPGKRLEAFSQFFTELANGMVQTPRP